MIVRSLKGYKLSFNQLPDGRHIGSASKGNAKQGFAHFVVSRDPEEVGAQLRKRASKRQDEAN